MLPRDIKDALDSILGDLNSEEADKKRKKYAPAEEPGKPAHGISITIIAGGKHPEPDGDEGKGAEPLEDPQELEKLLEDGEEPDEEPEEEPIKKPKKLRRY